MPIQRVRVLFFLSLCVGCVGGCLGVPVSPGETSHIQQVQRSQSGDAADPYEGWLFRKITGQEQPPTTSQPSKPASDEPLPAEPNPAYGAPPLPGTPLADAVEPEPDDGPRQRTGGGIEPEDFYLENIVKNIKAAAGYGPDRKIAKAALEKGEALFREGKYEKAAKELETAADRWPESSIEEDALFLLGECQFFADQYFKAHDTYGLLLKNHTNTRYLDTVMHRTFAIARYWDQEQRKSGTWPITPNLSDQTRPRFDTFGHAVEAYQRIRLHDPTGPLADHAVMALANGYFVRGQFENAAWNYDLVRREYPSSSYQLEAHLLGLQAKKRIYQGSYYDGKPLEEADEIVEQALTLFPGELGDEKDRLIRNRAQITEEQALRDYDMGQFYETKRCYGAARFYYNLVVENFPKSQTAQRARERMDAIRDKPDEPPNHFKWLTNLIPGDKR